LTLLIYLSDVEPAQPIGRAGETFFPLASLARCSDINSKSSSISSSSEDGDNSQKSSNRYVDMREANKSNESKESKEFQARARLEFALAQTRLIDPSKAPAAKLHAHVRSNGGFVGRIAVSDVEEINQFDSLDEGNSDDRKIATAAITQRSEDFGNNAASSYESCGGTISRESVKDEQEESKSHRGRGLRVEPRQGLALLFYNLDWRDGLPDPKVFSKLTL